MALPIPHRTWTADEFEKMEKAGILRPDQPVRLVGGAIVTEGPERQPRRWTFDEYLRLAEEGIIGPDERTELIDGEIVPMSPTGRRHRAVTAHIARWLIRLLGDEVIVSVRSTLPLPGEDGPEPDIAVLRYREDEYLHEDAAPSDILLIVEVAESSLSYDRGVKRSLYADAGIAEYWLVDLRRNVVIVYSGPEMGSYRDERRFNAGQSWTSPALGGREVRVEDVLGPAAGRPAQNPPR
jgi:Uma2 family endonuclease